MRSVVTTLVATAVSALAGLQSPQTPQRPVFQAGTDTVVLDIAVRHNGVPVLGLTQADFDVVDNGARQTIDHMSAETFPLDLTLIINQSGYGQTVLDQVTASVGTATDLLADDDHVRVLTFDATIQQLYEGSSAGIASATEHLEARGRASLFDALVAGLVHKRNPDRRSVAIAFTPGSDTTSTTSPSKLVEVARRSDVILDIFFVYNPDSPSAGRLGSEQYRDHLKAAAEATGGFVSEMLGDSDLTKSLTTALADFRARYALFYTIKSAVRAGWHDVKVTVKGHEAKGPGEYQVLVRKGYDGGK
jgi:VWFA-related protein